MYRSIIRSVRPQALVRPSLSTLTQQPIRFYAAQPITKDEVITRAFDALKTVATLQDSKISLESSFHKDLGLDSLDTVEALVALEEEFDLEIPDKVADDIKTVGEAVNYIYEEEQKL